MTTKAITLRELLIPSDRKRIESIWSAISSNSGVVSLKTNLESQFGHSVWTATLPSVQDSLGMLLDISILDIIVEAWNKHRTLAKYLDKSRYKPEEIIIKPLTEYTIKSVHHPYIEMSVDHTVVGKIEFEVTVTLKFEGAVLKIQNGRILEIQTGSCQGTIKLTLEKLVLAEMATSPIPLPGAIHLSEVQPVAV